MSGTTRHCPRCRTHVEDVGGFCLLGHRLNEAANTGSLTKLRAEVDRAFEDAKLQVTTALQGLVPPPPPLPTAESDLRAPLPTAVAGPVPTPFPVATPVPVAIDPPPPVAVRFATAPLVVDTEPIAGDPIVDFAPAPRMDWGPERQGLRKRFG